MNNFLDGLIDVMNKEAANIINKAPAAFKIPEEIKQLPKLENTQIQQQPQFQVPQNVLNQVNSIPKMQPVDLSNFKLKNPFLQ